MNIFCIKCWQVPTKIITNIGYSTNATMNKINEFIYVGMYLLNTYNGSKC